MIARCSATRTAPSLMPQPRRRLLDRAPLDRERAHQIALALAEPAEQTIEILPVEPVVGASGASEIGEIVDRQRRLVAAAAARVDQLVARDGHDPGADRPIHVPCVALQMDRRAASPAPHPRRRRHRGRGARNRAARRRAAPARATRAAVDRRPRPRRWRRASARPIPPRSRRSQMSTLPFVKKRPLVTSCAGPASSAFANFAARHKNAGLFAPS